MRGVREEQTLVCFVATKCVLRESCEREMRGREVRARGESEERERREKGERGEREEQTLVCFVATKCVLRERGERER